LAAIESNERVVVRAHGLPAAVSASILIVSIPTMLVFLFTQRTIMRGIAVPAEK
jgi:ABC-type glycerol-3-phosphate transport system permease component